MLLWVPGRLNRLARLLKNNGFRMMWGVQIALYDASDIHDPGIQQEPSWIARSTVIKVHRRAHHARARRWGEGGAHSHLCGTVAYEAVDDQPVHPRRATYTAILYGVVRDLAGLHNPRSRLWRSRFVH